MADGRKDPSKLQKLKKILGPCMIIFGLPLTIPGTAISVVPFYDETGFSKYGGLHVTGFLLLTSALVLIVLGFVLNCVRKATISPLEQVHLVSPWGSPRHGRSRSHPKDELLPCHTAMEII